MAALRNIGFLSSGEPGRLRRRLRLVGVVAAALGWSACGSGQGKPPSTPVPVADQLVHLDSSKPGRAFRVTHIGNFQITYVVGVRGDTPCAYSLALQPQAGNPVTLGHSPGPASVATGDRLFGPESKGRESAVLDAGLWTLLAATSCHWVVEVTPLPNAPVGSSATP